MREIKFRCKDENGEWAFFDFPISEHMAAYLQGYRHETLCQFTGIKDKNEKEIYEGDIIGGGYGGMEVSWCGDQSAGLGMNVGFYLQSDDFERWIELKSKHSDNGDNYEIIGNIFDNPELKTGAKDERQAVEQHITSARAKDTPILDMLKACPSPAPASSTQDNG